MEPDEIRKGLRARRMEERIDAAEAAARLWPPESTPLLIEAMKDKSHYVATIALRALGEQGDFQAGLAIAERFAWLAEQGKARDPGCRIRSEMAVALGKLDDSRAADVLLAGMRTIQVEADGPGFSDTATGLRGNCALALSAIRPPGVLQALSLLLFDVVQVPGGYQRVEPCRAAAAALAGLGEPGALAPLAIRLTCGAPGEAPPWLPTAAPAAPAHDRAEMEPELVAACMEAVAALDPTEALRLLTPYLRGAGGGRLAGPGGGTRAYLCASAALALAGTRLPEVLPLLLDAIENAPAAAQEPIALAVANLRSDEARAALLELAGHPLPAMRAAAAPALALFPDGEVLAVLKRLAAKDPDRRVRQAAAGVGG